MTKTTGVFVDIANIFYCCGKRFPDGKVDYAKYLAGVTEQIGPIFKAVAYGGLFGNNEAFVAALAHIGFTTKFKTPGASNRVDWSMQMALDIATVIDRLDAVVIGSADNNLVPLVEWIKARGIPCYMYACGVGRELKQVADRWYEIGEGHLETVAAA